LTAHAAGHAQALEHPSRRGASTDRAGRAVLALDTVAGPQAVETMTLHHAGEALALRGSGHVDPLAGLEHIGGQLLARGVRLGVGRADLDDVPPRRHARLLEMALQRLVHLARVDHAEGDLHGRVTVLLRRP